MQHDRTHVAIRSRSLAEVGDLTLLLMRRYHLHLIVAFAIGAVPLALLNTLLVGPILWQAEAADLYEEELLSERLRYAWLMAVLVILQTPLAGVFLTYYLGQAVFEEQPPWRSVLREPLRLWRRWVWRLGVVRGPLPALLLLAIVWGEPLSPGIEFGWLSLLLLGALGIRSFRPYLPEILVLEQCPLRSRDPNVMTLGRRSALLHAPHGSDVLGRSILSGLAMVFLVGSLFYTLTFLRGILTTQWEATLIVLLGLFPLALWIVAAVAVLVRFLNYLDCRIRLEGWEVELQVKAEAIRQFGEVAARESEVAA